MSEENVEIVRRFLVRRGKAVKAEGFLSRAEALEAAGLRE
jgi:hypothetical protein